MVEFFNLGVHATFFVLILVFIILMHIFKEEEGSAIVYGSIAAGLSFISGAMIIGGFNVVDGVVLFFDVNYYLAAIMFVIGMYSSVVSYNLWKLNKPIKSPLDMN